MLLTDLRPAALDRLDRFPSAQRDRIHAALAFAKTHHGAQTRIEGGPYYTHLVAVAQLLIDELAGDADTVIAGLLHDTVEDTPVTLADIEERFGAPVRFLVDALTEVGKGEGETPIPDKMERVRLTWEKVDRYALKDPRVYRIKIADRWHNLLTSASLRRGTQLRWIKEVRDRCIPLVHRLGLVAVEDELRAAVVSALARVGGDDR